MKIKILNEAVKTNVYKAECVLATNRDVNLTDVLNNIRALQGITIVNMVGKSRFVSKQKELVQVEMKFLDRTKWRMAVQRKTFPPGAIVGQYFLSIIIFPYQSQQVFFFF